MNKKTTLASALLSILLFSGYTAIGTVHAFGAVKVVPHQGHLIIESIGDPVTSDPAWAYDTASSELIRNVYETLMTFNREKTTEFVPALATSWTIQNIEELDPYTGITWKQRLAFTIRDVDPATDVSSTVKFHNGEFLTMEDVEYSFERLMVLDRSGGPAWMIYESVEGIGSYHAFDYTSDPVIQGLIIDHAFQVSGNQFIINLAVRYAPILGILAQSWASILDRSWVLGLNLPNEWDGNYPIDWDTYHDPPESPLDAAGNLIMGTGPYKLDYWTHGVEWSIVKFDDYWGGWPYVHASSFLYRVTEKVVYEWSTRLADFRAGTADIVYVPRQYTEQVRGWPGIRGFPDLPPGAPWGLPSLYIDSMFYNFAIDPATPYVGSGELDGYGIPLNFFSDIHIRKGFAYLFDYEKFLNEVWLGEAKQPSSPVIEGIPYHIDVANYYFSLSKAAEEFQLASADPSSPAHGVWDKGFYFKIPYNTGNVRRQAAAEMLKVNAFAVNSKFRIETLGVTWSTYLGELWWYPSFRSIMPIFIFGWLADYPDPHDFVQPFMHSQGTFTYPSSYSNPTVDALIEEGIATPDGSARAAVYAQLQWLYYQDVPSVCLAQPLGRHWERDWVQGWYYNPVYGGSLQAESLSLPPFYHMWEGLDGDVNGDHVVDILDWSLICAHWWNPPWIGPAGYYEVKYDIGPYLMYVEGGLPPPGDSVGLIDELDLAVVNAHWGESKEPFRPPLPQVPGAAIIAAPDIKDESLTPGTTFSIDIIVSNVEAMMGYQFTLFYDTNVLTATSVASYYPFTWELSDEINDPQGYVSIAYSMPYPELYGSYFSEPYPIARIDFTVQAFGRSPLDIYNSILTNIFGEPIPRAEIDGSFCNLPQAELVMIDIKPSSYPNSICLDDSGLLPVAILGSDTFDVNTVDPGTLKLGGVTISTHGSVKAPKLAYSIEDVNNDGHLDIMTFFRVSDLVSLEALTPTTTHLELAGSLFDGRPIEGTDQVVVVPPT